MSFQRLKSSNNLDDETQVSDTLPMSSARETGPNTFPLNIGDETSPKSEDLTGGPYELVEEKLLKSLSSSVRVS